MNFATPRNNIPEMLLYIWKVIDLPIILMSDLQYRISFELSLLPPNKAKFFIEYCIKNELLIKDDSNFLKLSEDLNEQINNWQKQRKIAILEKMRSSKKVTHLSKELSNFSVLMNAFVDKGTLNRSVSVSDAAFELLKYDRKEGIIKSKVKGSKEESYIIEVDTINKILRHNCSDFEERRALNKKFCKHIAKLFLLLKEKDENIAEFFLSQLAEDIDNWDFTF